MSGWIKLHRKMIEWEWFTDVNTCHLFLYLLLKANHKDKKWRGLLIKRGQFLTSLKTLTEVLPLSTQQIRTALLKLESTGEVTSQATNRNRLLTIVKYEEYQASDSEVTSQATNKQQTDNKQITTTKEYKKEKNEKNLIKDIDRFENFWDVYGLKVGRQDAKKAYAKIIKQGVTHETIIAGVEKYQSYCRSINRELQFIKSPTAWLNKRGWEDEHPIGSSQVQGKPTTDDIFTAGAHAAIRELTNQ